MNNRQKEVMVVRNADTNLWLREVGSRVSVWTRQHDALSGGLVIVMGLVLTAALYL
jgi:hypothetical protein